MMEKEAVRQTTELRTIREKFIGKSRAPCGE
jgi:hypothetical protein